MAPRIPTCPGNGLAADCDAQIETFIGGLLCVREPWNGSVDPVCGMLPLADLLRLARTQAGADLTSTSTPSCEGFIMSDTDNDLPALGPRAVIQLVDHDGRLYPLHALLAQLPVHNRMVLDQEAPQSGQAAWDFVTRHWPALADCIALGVEPVSATL